jgi:hypothetical protein
MGRHLCDFTFDSIFFRECRCEQCFGDSFYPNPGPIAPLGAREEIVSEGRRLAAAMFLVLLPVRHMYGRTVG